MGHAYNLDLNPDGRIVNLKATDLIGILVGIWELML